MQEDPKHLPPGPEVQSLQNHQVNLMNFTLYYAWYYQSQHLLYYVNCLWNLCSTLFLLKLQNVICSHSCIELKPHFITNTLLKIRLVFLSFVGSVRKQVSVSANQVKAPRRTKKQEMAAQQAAEQIRKYGICMVPIRMALFFSGKANATEYNNLNILYKLILLLSFNSILVMEEKWLSVWMN